MNKELKPCPFCGGKVTMYHYRDYSYRTHYDIYCKKCNMRTADFESASQLTEAWNRRVIDE